MSDKEKITKYITFSDDCIMNIEHCLKTGKIFLTISSHYDSSIQSAFNYYIHPFRYLNLVKFYYQNAFV